MVGSKAGRMHWLGRISLFFVVLTLCSSTAQAQPTSGPPMSCAQSVTAKGSIFAVAADGTVYLAPDQPPVPIVWRFDPKAHGDAVPNASICGPNTQIESIRGLSAAGGRLYLVGEADIEVFAQDASGDTAPARRIGGANDDNNTLLLNSVGGPVQILVGIDGTIYVLDNRSPHSQGINYALNVYAFAPGASGDVAPTRNFNPIGDASDASNGVMSIALDAKSRLYYVDSNGDVMMSRADLASPYTRVMAIKQPIYLGSALALDRDGKLYIGERSVIHVVSGATRGAPIDTPLAGPKTRISSVRAIATDAAGAIYVVNCSPDGASVLVFMARSTGDVAPMYELGGPHTHLSCPRGS